METVIKQIDGKWTVNGKHFNEWSILEHGLINAFFKYYEEKFEEEHGTTKERCNKFCLEKAKQLYVNDAVVVPTKVFDEAFDNPIKQ